MAAMTGKATREALEPFAKAADRLHENTPDVQFMDEYTVGAHITVGDLRRARTAYDAIGSGVKADSGWVEWTGGETPVEPGTEGLIRVEDGEVIYTKQLGSFNFAHDRSGPFPGRRIVAYRVLSPHTAAGAGPVAGDFVLVPREPTEAMLKAAVETCGMPWLDAIPPHEDADDFILRQAFRAMLAAAPSTSSPQNGDAGAGPVGEAVALWAEPDWRETLAKEGDLIVYSKKAQDWFVSVTTRPIDKPGLVERLTSERDAARAERDRALYFFHHRDFRDVGLPHPNDGMRHCTGINLDRLAAAKRLRDVGLVTIEDSPSGPMVAWASGRGAALKGDAQEGGK